MKERSGGATEEGSQSQDGPTCTVQQIVQPYSMDNQDDKITQTLCHCIYEEHLLSTLLIPNGVTFVTPVANSKHFSSLLVKLTIM